MMGKEPKYQVGTKVIVCQDLKTEIEKIEFLKNTKNIFIGLEMKKANYGTKQNTLLKALSAFFLYIVVKSF